MAPVVYVPKFVLDPSIALSRLSAELQWEQRDAPRMEYYCNDVQRPYLYGKGRGARTYEPRPWHPIIQQIRSALEAYTNATFEVCFLNRYLDQSHHLGWHADDSPEMDDERPIASVSLGVEREIWFRHTDRTGEVERLLLGDGSLCLMQPGMQDTWQHRIPKASFMCGERISFTFRGYVGGAP